MEDDVLTISAHKEEKKEEKGKEDNYTRREFNYLLSPAPSHFRKMWMQIRSAPHITDVGTLL